ncbi:hypothetical protein AU196_15630 [Mycobacterium sp. IS-1742]|uniref:hypothetical protein n=1 Tax=Mycobacterium sp. IS-1742 TaxID=1772285 RepID=UPI00074010C9|nr:hypothetical protein [Mycobacterium sp. IS-1742]KUI24752.1 hypothetical protein AU196_15630 [Mycobacterium sp. IS-1742]
MAKITLADGQVVELSPQELAEFVAALKTHPNTEPEQPKPRRRRRARPNPLGKRGARLEEADCIHPTTDVNDVCLRCGEHVPDPDAPPKAASPRRDRRSRSPRKVTPKATTWASGMKDHAKPVIERPLYNALNILIQHRDPMKRDVIADRLQIIPEAAGERLQELKKLGLATCEGKSWIATSEARQLFPRIRVA